VRLAAADRHGDALLGAAAPFAACGDHQTAGAPGFTALAAEAQRRTAGGGYFASRCKAGAPGGLPRGAPAAENNRRRPLKRRPACRQIAPSQARGRAVTGIGLQRHGIPSHPSGLKRQEPAGVLGAELVTQCCSDGIDTELAQVVAEVPKGWRQHERLDPGAQRTAAELILSYRA
jgi:hypothetical protein